MAVFGVLGAVCFASENTRVFTASDGREVEARIINVDDSRGMVELELANKRRTKVKPEVFSAADQAYIRDWGLLRNFQGSSSFKVEFNKKVIENWSEKGSVQRDFKKVVFEMEMHNRSSLSMDGLVVEYAVFYEQEQLAPSGQYLEKKHESERVEGISLAPRDKEMITTKPVVIFDQHLSAGYDGYVGGLPDRQNGEVKGVWVKVYMTTEEGGTVVREFCEPSSVFKQQTWVAPEAPKQDESENKKRGKKGKK